MVNMTWAIAFYNRSTKNYHVWVCATKEIHDEKLGWLKSQKHIRVVSSGVSYYYQELETLR